MTALLMIATGVFLAHALLPPAAQVANRLLDALLFGPLMGLGLFGVLDFLFRQGLAQPLPMTAYVWVTLAAGLTSLSLWRRRKLTVSATAIWPRLELASYLLLLPVLALATFYMLALSRAAAHGGWDGLAVWGVLARVLATSAGALQETLAEVHLGQPDYPLYLPEVLAILSGGKLEAMATSGQVMGLIGIVSLAGIVHRILARLGGPMNANLGLILLLTTPIYLRLAADHYADHLIAAQNFAACGFALLALRSTEGRRSYLLLCGTFLGMMIWTKAEGLILTGCILLPLLLFFQGPWSARLKAGGLLGFGMLPFVAVFLIHRTVVAPEGRRLDVSLGQIWQRLFESQRWTLVGRSFADEVTARGQLFSWNSGAEIEAIAQRWGFYFLALFVLLLLSLGRRYWTKRSLFLPVVILSQGLAYLLMLVTLVDALEFTLDNALSRLLAQIVPLPLLWIFGQSSQPEVEGETRVNDAEAAGLVEG